MQRKYINNQFKAYLSNWVQRKSGFLNTRIEIKN